jgi:hypothetical protein
MVSSFIILCAYMIQSMLWYFYHKLCFLAYMSGMGLFVHNIYNELICHLDSLFSELNFFIYIIMHHVVLFFLFEENCFGCLTEYPWVPCVILNVDIPILWNTCLTKLHVNKFTYSIEISKFVNIYTLPCSKVVIYYYVNGAYKWTNGALRIILVDNDCCFNK